MNLKEKKSQKCGGCSDIGETRAGIDMLKKKIIIFY